MDRKRKAGTEKLATAPDQDSDNDDDDQVEVRIIKSVVHDEFTQSSKIKKITMKGKKKKVVTWKSSCNHCEIEFPHRKTSVLKRHLNSKHSHIVDDKDDDQARVAHGTSMDTPLVTKQALVIEKYVKWVINSGVPLNTSDSEPFKKFIHFLDPDITIPGSRAIADLIKKQQNHH